jgi:ribosomal protein L9
MKQFLIPQEYAAYADDSVITMGERLKKQLAQQRSEALRLD